MATISFLLLTFILMKSVSNAKVISKLKPEARIIGGNVAHITDFPFMALITFNNGRIIEPQYCSSSIISETYVMTAAHCIHE